MKKIEREREREREREQWGDENVKDWGKVRESVIIS